MEVVSAFFPVILILFISNSSIQTWCFVPQSDNNCSVAPRHGDSFEIRFPFRLSDQPESCGYPGFELYYQGETLMLKLPFLDQPFEVYDIHYDYQVLLVSDPGGCLFMRLLNLNFSSSPFRLFNETDYDPDFTSFYPPLFSNSVSYYGNIKPLNCSSRASSYNDYLAEVLCASHFPGYYYWATDGLPSEAVPSFQCQVLTDDKFFLYINHLRLPYNALILKWDGCRFNRTSNETECLVPTWNDRSPIYLDQSLSKASRVRNLIIGLVISITFVVLAIAVLITRVILTRKRKDKKNLQIEIFLNEYKHMKPTRYSYSQLKKMADNFKVKLGRGAYGSVFKGKLPNGVPMAVKVLDNQTLSGEEFTNEIDTIGRIHHVNIVRLLGFCVEGPARALIYEFMPNESLDKYIAMEEGKNVAVFSWTKLHEISMGIALGMEYLHQGCDQRILHLDIKPQNILLDQEFNPKISDFGLAKLCSKERSLVSMTAVRGTVGYIAPEVFLGNNNTVSHKADVYSFGMLLLEMIGGRRKMDESDESSGQIYFPEWIYKQLNQGEELGLVTDTVEDVEIAKKLTKIALWCAQWRPVERPSMKLAVQMLGASQENLPMPPNPFASCLEEKILDCMDIVQE
ncbi:rust resistance kinase Lr10-like [Curcuma longa]|uniref:rust resistance kinase Lr10-like n=1 Tax=Curcuma longa TaxID=136217 RepID=UPI003D9F5E83